AEMSKIGEAMAKGSPASPGPEATKTPEEQNPEVNPSTNSGPTRDAEFKEGDKPEGEVPKK
ncbi:MAG: hypothetical protein Q7K11_01975, partial [Candidatus Berkelbacteria bacterium]|nr:hypothetical protein [Candidatus Berkelbacteria bacterium]